MFVDSHCHWHLIDRTQFEDPTFDGLERAARAAGVIGFLNIGTTLGDTEAVLEAVRDRHNAFAAIGVHPNETDGTLTSEALLCEATRSDQIIALGETGLDFYRTEHARDRQHQAAAFVIHMEVAQQLGKPLVIHTRNADRETIALLRAHYQDGPSGVLHCFTGDYAMAKAGLDLGLYVSFSGILTFRNAEDLRAVAARLPLSRLLIETDAPYLSPIPFRGKQNHSAHVPYVAAALAAVQHTTVEVVAQQTTHNFQTLFQQVLIAP